MIQKIKIFEGQLAKFHALVNQGQSFELGGSLEFVEFLDAYVFREGSIDNRSDYCKCLLEIKPNNKTVPMIGWHSHPLGNPTSQADKDFVLSAKQNGVNMVLLTLKKGISINEKGIDIYPEGVIEID